MGLTGEKVVVSQAITPRDVHCSVTVGSRGGDKTLQAGPQENQDGGGYVGKVRADPGTQRSEGRES